MNKLWFIALVTILFVALMVRCKCTEQLSFLRALFSEDEPDDPNENDPNENDPNENDPNENDPNENDPNENDGVPPQNCQGEWKYDPVQCPCGGGTQRVYFHVNQDETNGGTCPQRGRERTESCSRECIPNADCEGEWSGWGACSVGCGGGTQQRTWSMTKAATGTGTCNYPPPDTRACATDPCPPTIPRRDGKGLWFGSMEGEDNWNNYPCSAGCYSGTGPIPTKQRVWRQIELPQAGGAQARDPAGNLRSDGDVETKECNADVPCVRDVNCVGEWKQGDYMCNVLCGNGQRKETFRISQAQEGNGTQCEAVDGAERWVDCQGVEGDCPLDTATWKEISRPWYINNKFPEHAANGHPNSIWSNGAQTLDQCKQGCLDNNKNSHFSGKEFERCVAFRWRPDADADKKCGFSNMLSKGTLDRVRTTNEDTTVGGVPYAPRQFMFVNLTPEKAWENYSDMEIPSLV